MLEISVTKSQYNVEPMVAAQGRGAYEKGWGPTLLRPGILASSCLPEWSVSSLEGKVHG